MSSSKLLSQHDAILLVLSVSDKVALSDIEKVVKEAASKDILPAFKQNMWRRAVYGAITSGEMAGRLELTQGEGEVSYAITHNGKETLESLGDSVGATIQSLQEIHSSL